jgi:hypothetical protein
LEYVRAKSDIKKFSKGLYYCCVMMAVIAAFGVYQNIFAGLSMRTWSNLSFHNYQTKDGENHLVVETGARKSFLFTLIQVIISGVLIW